jgi:prefoldin beta subunit
MLQETDVVYKLVGPILMSVELPDSKDNVNKRLDFIGAEVSRLEKAISKNYANIPNLNFKALFVDSIIYLKLFDT